MRAQPGVLVMGSRRPCPFLNTYDFRRGSGSGGDRWPPQRDRLLVLEASSIVEIEFTAAKVLCGVIAAAKAAGLDFAVARLESVRAQRSFARFGIDDGLGPNRLFKSVQAAVEALASGVGRPAATETGPPRRPRREMSSASRGRWSRSRVITGRKSR